MQWSRWMEKSGAFKGHSWFNFYARSHSMLLALIESSNWKPLQSSFTNKVFQFLLSQRDATQMQHWGFMRKSAQNEKRHCLKAQALQLQFISFAAFFPSFRSVTTLENRDSFCKQHTASVCNIIVRGTILLLFLRKKHIARLLTCKRIDSPADTTRALQRPKINTHERWIFSINKRKMEARRCLMGSCRSSTWSGGKKNTSSQVEMMNRWCNP